MAPGAATVRMSPVPTTAGDEEGDTTMYHPETMYELAKLRMAEQQRDAEHERLARLARTTAPSGAIDAVRFRERLTRLFGAIWPSPQGGAAPTAV